MWKHNTFWQLPYFSEDRKLAQCFGESSHRPATRIFVRKLVVCCVYFSNLLCNNIYNCIYSCTFPNKLKFAPIHKSGDGVTKKNYRPVSILSSIPKIYENILYNQLNKFFNGKLSKLRGFRKAFSTQHCLVVMIKKWKKSIDQRKNAGALLPDLSKAFDCISHDLLLVS